MKAKYELTIVLPSGDDKVAKDVKKVIGDFVSKNGGKLEKEESWGVKELAYPIKKQTQAKYEHFVIEVDSKYQPELNRMLSLDERVLRYLFVRV